MKRVLPIRLLSSRRLALLGLSGVLIGLSQPARAASYTWIQAGASATLDWNLGPNWGTAFQYPSVAGDVANFNIDLAGNQTVRLRENITVGTLNLGDNPASGNNFAFTLNNEASESFVLTFDSGATGVAAQINTSGTGTPTNNLNAPMSLNSDLVVTLGGTDNLNRPILSFGGITALNNRTLSFAGGVAGQNQITFAAAGDFSGNGTIINNGNTAIIVNGTKTFTGTFILNKGAGGSNTGSLTLTSGGVPDAAEIVVNGFLNVPSATPTGVQQNGGLLHSGDNSARVTPGQRLTQNRITLNGGSLTAGGQNLVSPSTDIVSDTVAALDFNSGYSLVSVAANNASGGTRLNITNVERSPGASALVRSGTMAGTARLSIGNVNTWLEGGGGATGTTTMSIIPWMVVANTNGNAGSASTFATNTDTGIRGLLAAEYTNNIQGGAEVNYSAGNVAVPGALSSVTVNSVVLTVGSAANIGQDKTLYVGSGGVIIQNGNGGIGIAAHTAAGTLHFGAEGSTVEGVVWANGSNTNTIGATLSGSGGMTKAGMGTLILTGDNTYTGTTYVGGGTLQVGDGANTSNLGVTGDVTVANGAVLSLFNDDVIADTGTLRLEQFGLFNGKVSLLAGVEDTVAALFFGDMEQAAGTYGSTLSAATFKNDTYFSGEGVLTVVPEPGSAALLLGGLGVLMARRRRR